MTENKPAVEVCIRHGKKRQVEFLEKLPGTECWVCREGEGCKMSGKPGKREKELRRLLTEGRITVDQWVSLVRQAREPCNTVKPLLAHTGSLTPSCIPTSAFLTYDSSLPVRRQGAISPVPTGVGDQCPGATGVSVVEITPAPSQVETDKLELSLNSDETIASWADEVDKEYPLPSIELNPPPAPGASPLTPPPRLSLFEQRKPLPCVAEGCCTVELLARVSLLEQELSVTRRKLAKANGEMARAVHNERAMAVKFRNLQAEFVQVRQDGRSASTSPAGFFLPVTETLLSPEWLSPAYDSYSRSSVASSGQWTPHPMESAAPSLSTSPYSTPMASARSYHSTGNLEGSASECLPGHLSAISCAGYSPLPFRRSTGRCTPSPEPSGVPRSPGCFPTPFAP